VNLRVASEVLFALGRRYPRLPVAFLRAMPLSLLHALRAPALRETLQSFDSARGGHTPNVQRDVRRYPTQGCDRLLQTAIASLRSG
jgi:hypothetical protein